MDLRSAMRDIDAGILLFMDPPTTPVCAGW